MTPVSNRPQGERHRFKKQGSLDEGCVVNDWFKRGSESAPPAKPKFGILRLIIFAMIAFWLFAKFNKPRAGVEEPAIPEDRSVQIEPRDLSVPFPGNDRPRRQGDWSLEEVETKSGTPSSTSDSEIRFDPRGTAGHEGKPAKTPTKTTEGDWSMEEVETKKQ